MKIYARVVDNKIVEYPVSALHIKNRAHPLSWYSECIYDPIPETGKFESYREILVPREGKVYVSHIVQPSTLNELLSDINRNTQLDPTEEPEPILISSLDEEVIEAVVTAAKVHVQQRLDDFAVTKGYDNIFTAISYANSNILSFQEEALRARDLRDATWSGLHVYLGKVMTGEEPVPVSVVEIDAQLPELTW